jgi:hypothetical protein
MVISFGGGDFYYLFLFLLSFQNILFFSAPDFWIFQSEEQYEKRLVEGT